MGKIRMVVTCGEDVVFLTRKDSIKPAQGTKSVLHLDLSSGYTDVYIFKNSSSFIIEILIPYVM